jgi:bifunctional non-homologous end joining protein LigD
MTLREYTKKRHFNVTSEPSGKDSKSKMQHGNLICVVQKHRATQLHYDFRLEWKGVLLSWAVPKGPSLDPSVKRLAMHVEDHPLDYASFEGVIPEGEYGGGTVMVWDQGTWIPEVPDVDAALAKGDLKFTLMGKKLRGSWVLVRTRGYGKSAWQDSSAGSGRSWLLIKHRDEYASTEDIAAEKPRSAVSNKFLADIARAGGGNVQKAATGDPVREPARAPAVKPAARTKKPAAAKKSPVPSRSRVRRASK